MNFTACTSVSIIALATISTSIQFHPQEEPVQKAVQPKPTIRSVISTLALAGDNSLSLWPRTGSCRVGLSPQGKQRNDTK